MTRKTEDIFNNCLERMFKGESIKDCLDAYPKKTPDLEPLLKTSLAIARSSSTIKPNPEFKARAHRQFQLMLHAKQKKAERRVKISIWHRRWALATASILVVFLVGIGTAAASTNALPDESLYPIKLAAEQVRLTLAFSDVARTTYHVKFAGRRSGEMVEMARQGESDKISMLTEQIANHLGKVYIMEETPVARGEIPEVMVPTPAAAPPAGVETFDAGKNMGELEIILSQSRTNSLNALWYALDNAPEKLKPILEQAIEDIEEDYNITISLIESGSNQ